MKKFTTYKETNKTNDKSLINIIKENISLEISGVEKPWSKEIEFKIDEDLSNKIQEYLDQEILKAKLILLENIRLSYHQKNINYIEDEILYIRKNIK